MKIIETNKFKEHMKAHEKDFIIPWKKTLEICKENGSLVNINKSFEVVTIKMDRIIGYCNLVEVNQNNEQIIYAKRIGRDIYTKFIKNQEVKTTDCVTIFLNKSRSSDDYFLVTMFPGNKPEKEPEDKNISSYKELADSIKFWNGHALNYNEEIIQVDSIKNYCPYKDNYLKII